MFDIKNIKAIILDYGATIDSNGVHWAEVIWLSYQNCRIPVSKEDFKNAYIHGERTLATNNLVTPRHNFWHVLKLKTELQISWLQENNLLEKSEKTDSLILKITDWCYTYSQIYTNLARPILKKLSEKYPLILVTNFYGNISTVLYDFYLSDLFSSIIESSTAGVRKPSPEIFRMGVEKSGFKPKEVAVIGDSYNKDIYPASSLGCPTIWLKKTGWTLPKDNETADIVISDFEELKDVFGL